MRALLPEGIRALIREQIEDAVAHARGSFEANYALEEAHSGVVVHELDAHVHGSAGGFEWEMKPITVAPHLELGGERALGADIVVELRVRAGNGHRIGQKVVVVQAKKDWSAVNRDLLDQAKTMAALRGSGIVVDYTSEGYFAWPAEDVVAAKGDRRSIEDQRSLADMLGEFVDCRVGSRNLRVDETGTELVDDWTGESIRIRARHARVLRVTRKPSSE